jgi:hypothetical protein
MEGDTVMRKRFLVSGIFALVGLLLVNPVRDGFGLSLPGAVALCVLACGAVGYIISIVADVFVGNTGNSSDS